jgi:hypothetical protein
VSDYERRKEISIRVSGIMQALIGSPTYAAGVDYVASIAEATRRFLAEADGIVEERLK